MRIDSGSAANGFLKFDELRLIGIELERDSDFSRRLARVSEGKFRARQQVVRFGVIGHNLEGGAEKFRGQFPIFFLESEHSQIVQRAFVAGIGLERGLIKRSGLRESFLRSAPNSPREI